MSDIWIERFAVEYARLSGASVADARQIAQTYLSYLWADGFECDDGLDPVKSAQREFELWDSTKEEAKCNQQKPTACKSDSDAGS